jgi:REP element-mobilizing transposase RayT
VCAFAILSNHLHLVLRIAAERIAALSDDEVLERVRRLCPSSLKRLDRMQDDRRKRLIETWRERLSSLSWFMGKLDEHIARLANAEDGCNGRFWQGRFKANALLDEGALLTCMAYVDLNPVRAGAAEGLEDSSWASIRQRLQEAAAALGQEGTKPSGEAGTGAKDEPEPSQGPELAPMNDEERGGREPLPLTLSQYIDLLRWTCGAARQEERGSGTAAPSGLVTRCGLEPDGWLAGVEGFGGLGGHVGHPSRLKQRADKLGRRWLKGQGHSVMSYSLTL